MIAMAITQRVDRSSVDGQLEPLRLVLRFRARRQVRANHTHAVCATWKVGDSLEIAGDALEIDADGGGELRLGIEAASGNGS